MNNTGLNQSPIFAGYDLWAMDLPLRESVAVAVQDTSGLAQFGREAGSCEMFALGTAANEWPPRFKPVDEKGDRIDLVEYHPAYHALMLHGAEAGLHNSTHLGGSHIERGARFYMSAAVECGHLCPLTMTHASLAALNAAPDLADTMLADTIRSGLRQRTYDPSSRPMQQKRGLTIGMGMTERQGGSDVRSNRTLARRASGHYRLTGHKWFLSAPMSDAFLMLAQAQGGLTAFLVPRILPDGSHNGIMIQRLKDKLGNRSNASAEIILDAAYAEAITPEGEGLRAMLPMVNLTRLDCALASAGLMRLGLAVALHHAHHRMAFGRLLIDQPLMRAVLGELALIVEAATALVFRLCRAVDAAPGNALEAAYLRLMIPVAKFWICKLAPAFLYEAMECLGGNGYIEDGLLARAYREAPVNAIWEGSSNVIALDILRAIGRQADDFAATMESIRPAADSPAQLHALWHEAFKLAAQPEQGNARHIADRLALLAAASEMEKRLSGTILHALVRWIAAPGSTMLRGIDEGSRDALLRRAFPA